MRSMTAFGRAEAVFDGGSVTVELRSVNNRFLDCGVRIPRILGALEPRFKPYLQSRGISRGKVDVTVTVDLASEREGALTLDRRAAEEYIAALRDLRDTFGLADDISVMRVARREELFIKESKETALLPQSIRLFRPSASTETKPNINPTSIFPAANSTLTAIPTSAVRLPIALLFFVWLSCMLPS